MTTVSQPGISVLIESASTGSSVSTTGLSRVVAPPPAPASPTGPEFITVWKTDNPGTTNSSQILIYVNTNDFPGAYNYDVDWGDNTTSTGLTSHGLHTYPAPGTYTVKITGAFPQFYFNASSPSYDSLKLLSVEQWGTQTWLSFYRFFYDCRNLVINAIDTPDLSLVESMNDTFYNCDSFNDDISAWDVSNVQFMDYTFAYTAIFNQPLPWTTTSLLTMSHIFVGTLAFNQPLPWDTSSVSYMTYAFSDALAFKQSLGNLDTSSLISAQNIFQGGVMTSGNYDATLIGWEAQTPPSGVDLGFSSLKYGPSAAAARSSLISTYGWIINDGGPL